jgi:flagellar hook-associated protein 1 FlgK
MAKIGAMMDIGKRSMMNSQTALQTVSHNIANKTTEGYSRQRVDQVTAPPVVEGRLVMGMGSRAAMVSRTTNPALDKQLQIEGGKMGYAQANADSLSRVEQVFNEQQNKGINQYLSDFFNSFRELANNPESTTIRTMVKESGEALASDFKRINSQLEDIRKDIDGQVSMFVGEINKFTREIAELNEKIASIEINGVPANDQRDRRELLLRKLNEKIDIKFAEGDSGMVTVSTAGNALLVSGFEHRDLLSAKDPATDRMRVYFKEYESASPFDITDRIRAGALGGTLSVRDGVINNILDRVDELALKVAEEVNTAHLEGVDRRSQPGGLFFDLDRNAQNVSSGLKLSQDIVKDVGRIAAAAKEKSPGDNTVAHVIANLQYKEILEGKTSTIDDFYNSQIGQVGVLANRANMTRETQANILQQINTLRESVSGVSLDEETVKMIEHQKAFDASARMIRTADELFDTVLNLKRL